jgi:hypothetical protein
MDYGEVEKAKGFWAYILAVSYTFFLLLHLFQ